MIAIFETTIKNKQAGILTDSRITELFLRLSGLAQGDSPSGLLFLLALEPLLWKLRHSSSLEKVTFKNGNKISDSSFADDVTILLKGTAENIANAKLILDDFKKLSGLEINAEKTQILPINCPDSLELDISHLDFKVILSMTILGYIVSNNQNV